MSVWSDAVAALIETDLAATITYTPDGGSAQSVKAFVDFIDPEAPIGRASSRRETLLIEVRRVDLASPARDAMIGHAGKTYRINSTPTVADPDRLLWRIEASEVAP